MVYGEKNIERQKGVSSHAGMILLTDDHFYIW